jgi:apolipoprotein N-acyltransferase
MPASTHTNLRLVQPNAEQSLKWEPDQARIIFDRLISLTKAPPKLATAAAPDLVIWPETALPYLLEYEPDLPRIIAAAANGATVAFGRQRTQNSVGWNSLSILSPQGELTATYDKHHLVPFGEYIPFGDLAYDWFGLSAFAAQTGNAYMRGTGPTVLDLGPMGKMLPLICYEAVFPQDLRTDTRATWLLQITNDAWFGTLTGPYQHAEQARLRAIEQGLPMVRVANTGVTAVYDARGRTTATAEFGIATFLDTALPAPLPATIYARFGEWPVLLLLAGLSLGLIRRRKPLDA